MIRVSFKSDVDKKEISLSVKGHAGQAKKGHDLICAAASVLTTTVAELISFMRADGQLDCDPLVKLREGNSKIVCVANEKSYAEALHTFFVAQAGFVLLAKKYPQYVEINNMLGQS